MRIVALLLCLLLTGCASTRYAGELGQAADSASTLVAINAGFIEGNPVVSHNIWLLAIKPLIPYALKRTQFCAPADRIFWHIGIGAAVHNVILVLGAAQPVAWIFAVATLPATWEWAKGSANKGCEK